MLETVTSLLENALGDALSIMAFITPLPPEDFNAPNGSAIITRITYRGVTSGALELVCPMAFGSMLAGNILGTDPDSAESIAGAADSLRELLNVVCGTLLRNSGAAQGQSVEMGVPTQNTFDLARWDAFVDSGALVSDADGHKVALRLIEGD